MTDGRTVMKSGHKNAFTVLCRVDIAKETHRLPPPSRGINTRGIEIDKIVTVSQIRGIKDDDNRLTTKKRQPKRSTTPEGEAGINQKASEISETVWIQRRAAAGRKFSHHLRPGGNFTRERPHRTAPRADTPYNRKIQYSFS
ncbi:hypothetical protein EVAR_26602_1 [Eumeta japonica]|uniref:Uncharacterized protein n=1 Tax=Eumeta variegata TaxID=151549 RepID=A0A4C1XLW5_EUMVA|nr:hypothetical protein EVAR_26602_1 [Eumeta japonica]